MFKKYLYISVPLLFVLGFIAIQAYASLVPKDFLSFGQSVSYNAEVISQSDFTDTIWISAESSPDTNLDIKGNFSDVSGEQPIRSINTGSTGKFQFSFDHPWDPSYLANSNTNPKTYTYTANFTAYNGTSPSDLASYEVKVKYATINIITSPVIYEGDILAAGDTFTLKCENATNLKLIRTTDNVTLVDISTTTAPYILSTTFTNSDTTTKNYRLSCSNIGATGTLNFSTQPVASNMSGSLTASPNPCTIARGASSCNTTLTWNVSNPGNGSNSAVTSNTPSANTQIATGNSGTQSAGVPYGGRTFFLYNSGQASELAKVTVGAQCASGDIWDSGSGTCKASAVTCPSGQVADSQGYCHVPCSSGYTWNETSQSCDLSSCPQNQIILGGACSCPTNLPVKDSTGYCHAACPSGQTWDESSRTCKTVITGTFDITNISSSPNTLTKANTFTWNSTADYCAVHEYQSGKRVAIGSKSGQNWTGTMSAADTPNTQYFWYYVECSSATMAPADSSWLMNRTSNSAGRAYDVYFNCPTGQIWNSGSNSCVSAPVSGSISANPGVCSIAIGASTCKTRLTWDTVNPVNTSAVTSNYPYSGYVVMNANSGSNVEANVPFGGTAFFLYNSGDELARTNVITADCTFGGEWDPSSGTCKSAAVMTGTLTSSPNPCYIAAGASSCTTNLRWTTTNPRNVSAVTSNTTDYGTFSSGEPLATGDSGNINAIVPYSPYQERTFFLYNDATELGRVSVRTACESGTAWDTVTKKCKLILNCPAGTTPNSSGTECVQDAAPPVCDWLPNGNNDTVSCTTNTNYVCNDGTKARFVIDGGNLQNPTATGFEWQYNQYQYRYVCPNNPNPNLYIIKALTRPYTHFLTFNISASNVKKGTGVNLSWSVQDPNDSCKITAIDIKTGSQIFNSQNDSTLNSRIATSSYSSTKRGLAEGDYKSIKNSLFTINSSTRFTASCTNTGVYKPGYYQLVRDVYVTNEEER